MSRREAASRAADTGERAPARLRLLADISIALASSLDAEEALRRLSHRLVPQFAEACVVDLVDGDRVRRIEVTHRDPDRALRGLTAGVLPGPDDSAAPLARVLRGAGPLTLTDPVRPAEPGSLEAVQQDLYRTLEAGPVLLAPMRARREVLGALTLIRPPGGEPFGREDRMLATDLGHRAGLALENAQLYAFQQNTAEQLQRSLLPDLSGLDWLPLAARYVPARERAEVGGDWYDAFPLPDGTTVLAIGDVMGHDLAAAVRMGQLRNMLRALAYDSGGSPAEVMRRLDRVMQGMTTIELVTGVITRLRRPEAGPWTLTWTNAGHPPPLLTLGDGTTRLLEGGHAPILGLDPQPPRTDATLPLPPGATVLLYTDGLIERPGEDIGHGLTRLRQHAATLATAPLPVFCDELLTRLATGYHDDVAVLAFRVPEAPGPPAAAD
ncbi:PP2C family protein-serine/threonine phosphatase [Streptomyces sp. NPDC092296]|uniref:PP2C family protein-serine/threonine phosphatase n=1 Tax=Streptomyces sp. NPDC092296 TaxID=3366012 RepID=UPI00381204AC